MKAKHIIGLSCALTFVLGAATSLALRDNNPIPVKAESIEENMLAFSPGSKLSNYVNYQRYEGYQLTLSGQEFTNNSSAFVLKFHTISDEKCGLTFYLNGTQMSGASATPTSTYLYDETGYRSTVSHGSYAVGYFRDTGSSYVVVPFANFSNAATSATVNSFTIAIRLKGVTSADINYGSLNAYLRDISIVENYTPTEILDLTNATSVYKPTPTNFTPFDSGNTGITADCMLANYYDGAGITFAKNFIETFDSVCDPQGQTDQTLISTTWSSLATQYSSLSNEAKNYLKLESAKFDLQSMKDFDAKYSYIFSKYGTKLGLENFVGRTITSVSVNPFRYSQEETNFIPLLVVASCVLVSLIGVVGFIQYKKKHQ